MESRADLDEDWLFSQTGMLGYRAPGDGEISRFLEDVQSQTRRGVQESTARRNAFAAMVEKRIDDHKAKA